MTGPGNGARPAPALKRELAPTPRLALQVPGEAAASLGVSADFFREHVAPDLRLVRRGRLMLVGVRELQAWLDRESARTLDRP